MKICSKCDGNFDDYFFEKNRNQCKNCIKEIRKVISQKYIQNNKNLINMRSKEYNQKHKNEIKIYRAAYILENKDIISNTRQKWLQNNKENIRKSRREYQKDRKKNDLAYKFRANISTLISRAFSNQNLSKNNKSCLLYLSYTFEDLTKHLEKQFEPWMNWDNYDSKSWDENNKNTWRWNLDHIIPQSDLPYTSMEDDNFKKCWAINNLRPLSSKQNNLDGVKRIRHIK